MRPSYNTMNIYFTASIVGKKDYLANYKAIIDAFTAQGHAVQAEHILNITEPEIHMKTREERLKFHERLEQWIQACDFMVVESSFPSISVGYEISLALQYRKPVLLLYSIGDPPSLFAHHEDVKIVCEKYTLDTLQSIISDFLRFVQGEADTRFTFFISSKQAAYLAKQSKKLRMPKSVFLRSLIDADMDKR